MVHVQSLAMVFSSFFLGSSPAPLSPMPSFHYSSYSANHSDSFASRFLSMLCLARSLFRKRMTGWSRPINSCGCTYKRFHSLRLDEVAHARHHHFIRVVLRCKSFDICICVCICTKIYVYIQIYTFVWAYTLPSWTFSFFFF